MTRPGTVLDEELNRPEAQAGLVNGMSRAVATGLSYVALTGGAVTRELVGRSTVESFGVSELQRVGILDPGDDETAPHWERAQRGRWVAEDGVRRLRLVLGDGFETSPLAARALLQVGHANRILGENMCQAVIDGGPAQPRRVSFERAEAAFSEALELASRVGDPELELAALAGRAATRIGLGDWGGATADARAVPDDFVFQAPFSDVETEQYNRVYWGGANRPFRSLSVVGTFFETYYLETGDPRTPWSTDPDFPTGSGGMPYFFQTKYGDRSSPVNLSSGREMRLIEAEALLRGGDVSGALVLVNALRVSVGVEPAEATSLEEAWTALKRERAIELWLEGRRLWDLHRWIVEGTPGATEDMTGRSTCFPIGRTEADTNPHLELRAR